MNKDEIKQMVNTISEYEKRLSDKYIEIDNLNRDYRNAFERLKSQQREIDALKAENKQLKTECALLDNELRIARQDTIDVLNKLKTKLFTIFGKTMCSDLDTEDITDIIDELLREYE